MEQCMVSVLITFYNSEQYVDDCLKSVFSQKTTFPFKVIVGDDGSTDGTVNKIKEWKERYPERLSYIIMPREVGKKYVGGTRASRNRLALLGKVDTKYFQYLDGDDYWTDTDRLQMCYDVLENPTNRDCVGCGHAICMFHEKNPSQVKRLPGSHTGEGKYQLKRYWKDMYFHTDTILFRSENIAKIRRDLLEDSFNDNLITYSFMQFGPMYYVDKEMAAYRQNDNGIWAGERKVVGVLREIILYDLECKINSDIKHIAFFRHFHNFRYVHKNRDKFVNLEAYYQIAESLSLSLTKKTIKREPLFSNSNLLEGIILGALNIPYVLIKKSISVKRKIRLKFQS